MESFSHQRLKALCVTFLRDAGCVAAAIEVRCPASRFRIDVAGYADPISTRGDARPPAASGRYSVQVSGHATTVLVECKQSRADFFRDSRNLDRLLSERRDLDERRRHLEERLIKPAEPHLRGSGSMLFAELEAWDFAASRSPSYRAVLRDLRRVDQQIHGNAKFCMIARHRLADVLLIAAPRGMIRGDEVPPGWGLVEFPLDELASVVEGGSGQGSLLVQVRHPSASRAIARDEHRVRLLRNIAVAATSRASTSGPGGSVPTVLDVAVRPLEPS